MTGMPSGGTAVALPIARLPRPQPGDCDHSRMGNVEEEPMRRILTALCLVALVACEDQGVVRPEAEAPAVSAAHVGAHGVLVVNGWYEGEEIYYIDLGPEEGVTERGENDLYFLGAPRLHQANVVEFIPGEPGYSPHWNIHAVNTATGVNVADIVAAGYASASFEYGSSDNPVLFEDVADILAAEADGLVTITSLGLVVLCPVVAESVADAPGNTEAPEDEFVPFTPGTTF